MKNATLNNAAHLLRATCFSLVILSTPSFANAQGRILINEYLPWPNNACGTTAEFIELYNFGPGPVNIGGYIITDGDYAITIPSNTIVLPGKYFVLAGQNTIPQDCGNDLRNITVNLNWNTCGCTSAPIPTIGDGFITDGGSSNEQIVLLDKNLNPVDAIVRNTPVEASLQITTSTVGGQYPALTFDLDNMGIAYETVGESAGRGNSFARKVDGGCGWIKDTRESAGDVNNTTGLTLDWNAALTLTKATTCLGLGSVSVNVSNALVFPVTYTLAKDVDGNFIYDFNDTYQQGTDYTAPDISLAGLDAGSYRLTIESRLGCDLTQLDFSILGCTGSLLNYRTPTAAPDPDNSVIVLSMVENPFREQCHVLLKAPAKGSMQIVVYNINGRPVLTENIQVLRGDNTVRLPAAQLPPGMYILQLRDQSGIPVKTIKAIRQ